VKERLDAVVFDLFHTLVDPEDFRPRDFDRVERVAAVLGVEAGPFAGYWQGQLRELVVCPDRPSDRAAAYALARGLPVSRAQWEAVDGILGRYQDLALEEPRPEVLGALRALRRGGMRLGLLSNAHERDLRAWERSPLRPLLDAAVFSCFAGHAKPTPEAYGAALAGLGVAPGRAAFAGDGGSGELEGARRYGFGLVVLVSGPALRSGLRDALEVALLEAEADLHVTGVEDLPALLLDR
jgi:putative hydrolase of the HAD superfamily